MAGVMICPMGINTGKSEVVRSTRDLLVVTSSIRPIPSGSLIEGGAVSVAGMPDVMEMSEE